MSFTPTILLVSITCAIFFSPSLAAPQYACTQLTPQYQTATACYGVGDPTDAYTCCSNTPGCAGVFFYNSVDNINIHFGAINVSDFVDSSNWWCVPTGQCDPMYEPFVSGSAVPSFPATPMTISTQPLQQDLTSQVTVTMNPTPTLTNDQKLRFFVTTAAPDSVGSVLNFTQPQSGAFWDVNDWSSCSASGTVSISPLNCASTSSSNSGEQTVTFTCTIYATLLTPNPTDATQYMASTTELTVAYNFAESATASQLTSVAGVFCGVTYNKVTCVASNAALGANPQLVDVLPANLFGLARCAPPYGSFQANPFRVSCSAPAENMSYPLTETFVLRVAVAGNAEPLSLAQAITFPIPQSSTIDDKAIVFTKSPPAVIGNYADVLISVQSRLGGQLSINGFSYVSGSGTVAFAAGTEYAADCTGNSCDITWHVLQSVRDHLDLVQGEVTLQVTTTVTNAGTSAERRQVVQDNTYQVQTSPVCTTRIQRGASDAQGKKGLSAGVVAAVAISAAAAVAITATVAIRAAVKRHSETARRDSSSEEGQNEAPVVVDGVVLPYHEKNPFSLKIDVVHDVLKEDKSLEEIVELA